jgi:hypothetical protein
LSQQTIQAFEEWLVFSLEQSEVHNEYFQEGMLEREQANMLGAQTIQPLQHEHLWQK